MRYWQSDPRYDCLKSDVTTAFIKSKKRDRTVKQKFESVLSPTFQHICLIVIHILHVNRSVNYIGWRAKE